MTPPLSSAPKVTTDEARALVDIISDRSVEDLEGDPDHYGDHNDAPAWDTYLVHPLRVSGLSA